MRQTIKESKIETGQAKITANTPLNNPEIKNIIPKIITGEINGTTKILTAKPIKET